MEKKEYFKEYYKKNKNSKFMNPEINEVTQKLYEFQSKYSTGKKLLKAYVIYFYYCIGMDKIAIANYLQSQYVHVQDAIYNMEVDSTVWRSNKYYLAKEIKEFANEYKTKI